MTVSDALPANTTFVSASDGGAFNGGVVTWNIGSVAAGATLTRTVTVVVNSVIPAGVTQIVNAASVQGDGSNGGDSNPANNTASRHRHPRRRAGPGHHQDRRPDQRSCRARR